MIEPAPGSTRRMTAIHGGVVMALVAVVAGTLFGVRPPEAYGICMACHGSDLVSSLANAAFGTEWPVAEASVPWPVLTTLGVLVGSAVAARRNGEFRWYASGHPLPAFASGVLVMIAALVVGGCSTRLWLRLADGDPLAGVAVVGMLGGIALSTFVMRWWSSR